jgi:hypothetical protein
VIGIQLVEIKFPRYSKKLSKASANKYHLSTPQPPFKPSHIPRSPISDTKSRQTQHPTPPMLTHTPTIGQRKFTPLSPRISYRKNYRRSGLQSNWEGAIDNVIVGSGCVPIERVNTGGIRRGCPEHHFIIRVACSIPAGVSVVFLERNSILTQHSCQRT